MLYRVLGTDLEKKQKYLLSLAKDAFSQGKKVYILVPEQATALYERLVLEECGPASSLLVEVTCFSRLPNLVLRSWGNLSQKSVTEEEKKLLLSRVVNQNKNLFPHLPIRPTPDGISALLEETEEIFRAGISQEAIDSLAAEPHREELCARLEELLLAFRLLREEMGEGFSDPSMEEEKLGRILEEFEFFRSSVVLLDLFWDFTAPQEKILKHILSTADILAVSFLLEKGGAPLFSRSARAARRLLRLAREENVKTEDISFIKEGSSSLDHLRDALLEKKEEKENPPEKIRLVECAHGEAEALFVADAIRDLVEKGARWQEIAVLSRSGEALNFLSMTLEGEKIPFFLETKKPLLSTPLSRTLLSAAKIALGLGQDKTLREYLTYGVFQVKEEERFALAKYVATWNLYPSVCLKDEPFLKNPDGYQKMLPHNEKELEKVNRGREAIFNPLRSLAMALSHGSVGEKVSALVAFLTRIGAEEIYQNEMEEKSQKGDWEGAQSTVQEWNTVLTRLSSLGRALGGEEVGGKEFFDLLTLALSGTLGGTLPQGQDRVQLGTVDFMRPMGAKHIFLLGMNTGLFPMEAPRGLFLSQKEREFLEEKGFAVSSSSSFAEDEAFFFYLACLFAKESLTLSYCTEAGGISLFAKEVQRIFPDLPLEKFDPRLLSPRSREGALRYLLSHGENSDPLSRALALRFAGDTDFSERQLLALSGRAFRQRKIGLAKELPYEGRDISMTYSRLEKYSTCRFAYFALYLLEAKEDRPADMGANIKGTFVHKVLEVVLEKLATENRSLSDLGDEELKEENRLACRIALAEIAEGELAPDAAYLVSRLEKSTLLILKNLREEFANSAFTPLFFEKKLEEVGGYEIDLEDGTKLRLFGSIDRVDLYRSENGEDWVRVVDYKTGGHDFDLKDVANGLSMQMLLYLFALWGRQLREGGSPALPAGVLYLNGMDKITSCSNKEALEKVKADPYYTLDRQGLLVNEDKILRAADPEMTGRFIPLKKENLVTLAEMGRLRKKAEGDFARLANQIKKGRIEPDPLCKSEMDGCDFCPYLPLCKREKKDRRLYRRKVSREEIFGKEEEE